MTARSSIRTRLLIGASAGALVLGAAPLQAGSSNPFARIANPAAQAAQAAAAQAQQGSTATAASQRALAAFAQAAAIRRNMDAAQVAARAAAAAAQSAVRNGLGAGGLQVDPGVAGDPSLWLGANAPTQSTGSDGRTKVDVTQTQAQAILNWQTFNVGQNTDLTFNQGGSSWAVLNRVNDPGANPTQILGTIKAPGTVLIMNRNGVIFGGASQVNVGNLIAAAGAMTDAQFLTNGIYSSLSSSSYAPSITDALGQVKVAAGAQITTNAPATALSGGGYVMLLGGSVENDGSITTPKGQTLLAAGDSFLLRTGLGTGGNQYSTTRGNEIASQIAAGSSNGTVSNAGLITATQGDITLAGRTVAQNGIAIATTSITQRGTIHLLNASTDTLGSITLGTGSYTAVLPELDSTDTALDSQRDALIADSATQNSARTVDASGQFNDLGILPDREDQSRIEINTGGSVEFKGGSLTQAQGGQVSASAVNRIQVDSGATIDVSGVQNVALDASTNMILVNIQGNELRDSAVNRDNPDKSLYNQNVWVNADDLILVPAGTGGATSDRYYTAGGLLEVSGYVGNTGHTIGEWAATGGTITLQAKEVVAQKDSLFDVAGGSLAYQGGDYSATLLQGADGKMYTADDAPANIEIVSVGKSFSLAHPRWGDLYTETWQNPFAQTTITRHEDGYVVGKDGGQLILSTPTALFEGTIEAETIQGVKQVNPHPASVTDGYKVGQSQAALNGGLILAKYNSNGLVGAYDSDVQIGTGLADAASGTGVADPIDPERANTAWFDAGQLSQDNLGTIKLVSAGSVTLDAPLTLAHGGGLTLVGAAVTIDADVTTRSGSITASNILSLSTAAGGGAIPYTEADGTADVTVSKGVTLDLRGLWTNALTDPDTATDIAYANGGNVMLDGSQNVTVGKGAVIDVSAGGGVLATGKTVGGRGGNVTLIAGDLNGSNNTNNPAATLSLDGTIHAEGVLGGGTLTISAPGSVAIGDDASLSGGQLTLAPGTPAHVNLTLAAPITIPAGEPLPLPYNLTGNIIPLDVPIPVPIKATDQRTATSGQRGVTTQADWVVPQGMEADNFLNTFQVFFAGSTVPAGTNISVMSGTFPVGTVIPSAVFPNGVVTQPFTVVYGVGAVVPTPVTYGKGTVIPAGTVFSQTVPILPVTTFDPSLFQSGFANYVVNAGSGLLIASGTHLAPEMPVYQITGDSLSVRSGADPDTAMTSWLPPLFQENPQSATLTQRGGASITLRSIATTGLTVLGGAITVPDGASITVDPGQSIKLDAFGQITVDGDLTAHGGAISLISEADGSAEPGRAFDSSGNTRPLSIWVGDHALLDVSGEAYSATDRFGHAYGTATNGGSIEIGGTLIPTTGGGVSSTQAFVIIRPGAELNADGTHIAIDPMAGTGTTGSGGTIDVATNGGSISLDSFSGFYLDGDMHARAGGAGAQGGSISLLLEVPVYSTFGNIVQTNDLPIETLTVVQHKPDSLLPADIAPGTDPQALVLGQGTISADAIEAGGFANVTLNSRDFLTFSGDVSLHAAQSISLIAGAISSAPFTLVRPTADSDPATGHVTIAAPYVYMGSPTILKTDNSYNGVIGAPGVLAAPTEATFEVDADQIDFQGAVSFSASTFLSTTNQGFVSQYAPGYADVRFDSKGDIRFLAPGSNLQAYTSLVTPGDLDFVAAQLYPATNAIAYIAAADGIDGPSTLTIARSSHVDPGTPLSVFGQITLVGGIVRQGGIVRAPLGQLTLGSNGGGFHGTPGAQTQEVDLLPGSITSVSGAGLIVPYGGTPDGVNYNYNGAAVNPALLNGGLTLDGVAINVGEGALIDTSGGATVAGAAFIPGRGGSVDVLKTPLINANPKTPFSASSDKVYAIVPGYAADYAPVSPEKGAGDPVIGQQVTIPVGVPGLPAGTYTLLPSNYATLPGAYRVEIGKAASPLAGGVNAIGNGTYVTSGYTSIANTTVKSSLPATLLITSGTDVRSLSQYNEESYSDFIHANAGTIANSVNTGLGLHYPADAEPFSLLFENFTGQPADGPVFSFEGQLVQKGGVGGSDGGTGIFGAGNLEIFADAPTDGFTGTSLPETALTNLHPVTLGLNGSNVYIRPDVTIEASQITLSAQGTIDVGQGATLSTIGMGDTPANALGNRGVGNTTLLLSNGEVDFTSSTGTGAIIIENGASLFAGDTLAFATNGSSSIDSGAHFGAKNIALAVSAVNIGSTADIAAAGNPAGLQFDQDLFNFLIEGDPTHGAPALESLTLSASSAVNVFGSASLDASGTGVDLVLTTPAIYGFGGADDHAVIAAGKITWNGIANGTPPAILAGGAGTGVGTIDIKADEIDFGTFKSGDNTNYVRTLYGFGTVDFDATDRIVSAGNGLLAAYQAPSLAAGAVFGQSGTGGNINLVTPVLTGAQKSDFAYATGGTIGVSSPVGTVSTATSTIAGGEIDLNADNVAVNSTVLLPSGQFVINATHDIDLGANSRIDLSGQTTMVQDAPVHGFGGNVILASTSGNVTQDAGSIIDVSAVQANAGAVRFEADGGTVSVGGTLKGAADDGFASGGFTLVADQLGDFAALNGVLNDGGFFDTRSFELKTGDLTVGDGVKARDVEISVDGGSLTVTGTIDASGKGPGTIRLAGKTGLTLASSAVLDAHGNALLVDSYGQPIEALNRGHVELQAAGGTLTLASGATIDLSSPDGVARGDVELDARRTSETGGDIAIDASGPLTIKGAGTIAVNGFWTYSPTDPYGTIVQDNGMADGSVVNGSGWLGMDQIDGRSQAFINAALGNGALLGRLQGLRAYADAFHLRPGVEIDSATPTGTLTIAGDIDLAGFRYASLNPHYPKTAIYGSGEPGALVIRAGGNLDIVGSVSDGFMPAPATPDDSGWLLQAGAQTSAVETLVPITLNAGTTFPNSGGALRYAIPINGAQIAANATIPAQVTLSSDYTVPVGTTLTAPIFDAGGNPLYAAGTVFSTATTLPAGSQLGAGSRMPSSYGITAMTWPAGASLNVFASLVSLSGSAVVPFEGIIPSGAVVQISGSSVPTRPTGMSGTQGSILALAPMLPDGELSWSVRMVAGADLDAADTRTVKPAGLLRAQGISGNLTLVDLHKNMSPEATSQKKVYFYYYYDFPTKYYTFGPGGFGCTHYGNTSCGIGYQTQVIPASINGPDLSVVRTGTGNLDLIAGGSFDEETLFGAYTAGTQSAPILAADGSNPYNQPRGLQSDGTLLGVTRSAAAVAAAAAYAAWYPEHGGDVFVSAQGNLTTAISFSNNTTTFTDSDEVANWLWRQGGGGVASQPTAWWINFGTYMHTSAFTPDSSLVGFQGIGTLGGGNLTVTVGGNAGNSQNATGQPLYTPLDLAVASSGRVLPDGTLVQTGGGDLVLKVGGVINPGTPGNSAGSSDTFGVITDLRGNIDISAGALGAIGPGNGGTDLDPRTPELGVFKFAYYIQGPVVIPGDGTVDISTRRDLVLGGVGDATMENPIDNGLAGNPFTQINPDGTTTFVPNGSITAFTLWHPTTAITLFSSGGDVSPQTGFANGPSNAPLGFYPGTLLVAAQSGDIRFAGGGTQFGGGTAIELMPSPIGQLELLADGSIYGQNQVIAMSGASMDSLATPQHPAFYGPGIPDTLLSLTNISSGSAAAGAAYKGGQTDPIAFGPDTPIDALHAGDSQPALVYAGTDIVDLQIGQVQQQTPDRFGDFNPSITTWYIAAKPFNVIAGRDILGMGASQNNGGFSALGQVVSAYYNVNPSDITQIHAGRDLYFLAADIAGPGLFDVEAGRNLMQGFRGTFESVGPLYGFDPTAPSTGAGIFVAAGVGANGPDYTDFANLYLNPANAADPSHPLAGQDGKAIQTPDNLTSTHELAGWLKSQFGYAGDDAGAPAYFNGLPASDRAKYPTDPTLVTWLQQTQGYAGDRGDALTAFLALSPDKKSQFTYNAMLTIWLQQRFGYTGTQADAFAYFTALPKAQQGVFVREVYYDELTIGGREYNDPSSERFQSYLRGRNAIATLFPEKDAAGNPITYDGTLTMYSGLTTDGSGKQVVSDAGIRTDFGGSIQILNPAGQTLLGVEGVVPGPTAGLLTQGVGDIDIYSEGSILLGESRVLTTYGGNVLAWSATGDINSGRGSKTTVIFAPPRRVYDDYGNVTLSPSVPSSGAGIGTLAPIAEVPPGDVDLIAPLGTIDAGEAGIRVSGNVNLAALHIVNAANIQVKGNATGIPVVAAVDTGALSAASSTAAAVSSVAEQLAERARPKMMPQVVPSIITGRVVGFGE